MTDVKNLFDFIKSSPSPYHTVEAVRNMLEAAGYTRLYENDSWSLTEGGKYYVIRNGSSLIAFRHSSVGGFMICASHSDSPSFKAKSIASDAAYARLSTEKYGGMIMYSWLDRPLSIAGRVVLRTEDGVCERLVNLDADLFTIPSLAIHMNRDVNSGYKFNPATDMLPITSHGPALEALVAEELAASAESVLSHDLYLYARDEGREIGRGGEYILAPRLDDLECVYASTRAFLDAAPTAVPVLAVFDNEEVGSSTKQGAASDLLISVLTRISGTREEYSRRASESFMVSADNAHAKHPAHPELSDKENAPLMNEGIVIKHNASQAYATDAYSEAVFSEICRRAGAKLQSFYNRADLRGGSTLGSISDTVVSIPTVDIGLAQLAMHSAVETAGAADLSEMIKALTAFYSTALVKNGTKTLIK